MLKVKTFYSISRVVQVQCNFHRKFNRRKGPNRLVHKSENTGAVTNNKKGVVSRNRMRTMNKIVHVNEAVI
jgi:hypothetical protein